MQLYEVELARCATSNLSAVCNFDISHVVYQSKSVMLGPSPTFLDSPMYPTSRIVVK